MVLENGVVTQLGTHAELVREGGLYRELLDLQAAPRPGSDLRLNQAVLPRRGPLAAPPAPAPTASRT